MFSFPDASRLNLYSYDEDLVYPCESGSVDADSIDIIKECVNDYDFIWHLVECAHCYEVVWDGTELEDKPSTEDWGHQWKVMFTDGGVRMR